MRISLSPPSPIHAITMLSFIFVAPLISGCGEDNKTTQVPVQQQTIDANKNMQDFMKNQAAAKKK